MQNSVSCSPILQAPWNSRGHVTWDGWKSAEDILISVMLVLVITIQAEQSKRGIWQGSTSITPHLITSEKDCALPRCSFPCHTQDFNTDSRRERGKSLCLLKRIRILPWLEHLIDLLFSCPVSLFSCLALGAMIHRGTGLIYADANTQYTIWALI